MVLVARQMTKPWAGQCFARLPCPITGFGGGRFVANGFIVNCPIVSMN